MLNFQPAFPLSSVTFIKRLLGSSLLSAFKVVSSAYLKERKEGVDLKGLSEDVTFELSSDSGEETMFLLLMKISSNKVF